MKSQELQIQEKDCGDYWSVAGGIVDVEAERFALRMEVAAGVQLAEAAIASEGGQ
jgi:hypothetical protein